MKKLFFVVTIMILGVSLFAQPQLTWRFNNAQLTNGGTTFEFDVEVMCDQAGVFLGDHTQSWVYNTVGFGENIVPTNVVATKGTLLIGDFSGTQKYDIAGFANTFPNTMSASCLTNMGAFAGNAMFHNEFPIDWTGADFMHFVVTIDPAAPGGALAGIAFTEFLMNGQQYYQNTAAGNQLPCLDPNFYVNDLLTFVIVPGGPVPTDWTGAVDENWEIEGNWTAGIPTGDFDQVVTIDATTKAAPVIYGSVVAGILNLIAGQLTIAPGGDLTTTGLFTNDGHLQMSNLLGVSASFWPQAGLATTAAGTFQYDRDVFCSGQAWNSNDPFGWHYISSPIAGFTTDDIPDYFVNAWNEGATGVDPDFPWMHYGYDPYVNPCLAWPQTPMNPLDAWSVNFDPAYPYTATCGTSLPPGTGNIVEFGGLFTALNDNPAGYSAPATAAGGHAYAGWNFYGNPYAASLDPALFNWTGFDNGTYGVAMWSEDCSVSNYIYSGLGNGYVNYVGPTQGFFMLTTGATTFALTGGERAHTSAASIYKDEVTNLLTLEAAGDGTSDVTYIRFMEDMEAGNDVADFPKLFSTSEGLAQIYTTALGEKLAINALPATLVVPMGFTSVTTGEYTISAIETSEFADVVLEDLVTGEQTDLLINSYTFNYTVNDDADRFLVHFTPLGIGDNLANSINIWSNDHKIYVQVPEITGDIVVFNMMGQEVIRTEIEPGLNIIPVNDRNSYYVVKVVSSDVARTGKVYVK